MLLKPLLFLALLIICSIAVFADRHYTFEHAEEMRTSGRVDWRDYGPEPFQEAIEQNKPIFLMLTAPTWCYWCHVYTSDEYVYNEQVYPLIDDRFIPIYVDADQRQDLTRQYLEGGWPSTTVLTPGMERLFGYSGPRPIPWMQDNLNRAADFVATQGYVQTIQYNYQPVPPQIPTNDQLNNLINNYAGHVLGSYDSEHGGFGTGQKFPQGRVLDFSLDLYEQTGDRRWLDLVENTLENQYTVVGEIESNYNLFDPVEGAFHRYGVQRDWTPPHYEKMLYDNARLLKAYFHLTQLNPENTIAQEVVAKTHAYIDERWYDHKNGGFFGNSDVHGEHHYYGLANRPSEKPRVEQTKYSDWNSDAILAYLYLYQQTNDEQYKAFAERALDFFADEMITRNGALHYSKPDGEKGVTGSLLDNAYLTLAFIEGYEVLNDDRYLDVARQLADFSLGNLYDWNSGGFFERNSPDIDSYAPGEHVRLSIPSQENGIMTYAMMKLFTATQNQLYLNAAVKTMGRQIDRTGTLDRGYYYIIAAQYALSNNLLGIFETLRTQIESVEQQRQENFWVDTLIENANAGNVFVPTEKGLEKLEAPIIVLLFVALIAGFLSFASPCTLPILPAYVAFGLKASKRDIKGMTLAFFLGLSIVFMLLGMSATFVGAFLRENLKFFAQGAGAFVMLFGVLLIFGIGWKGIAVTRKKPTSYIGAFFFGSALGVSWAPCVGPILVAILVLASTTSSAFTGGLLLFAYAIGLALPLFLFSTYIGSLDRSSKLWRMLEGKEIRFRIADKQFITHTTSLVSGLLFIVLGYLIFSGILFAFNQYVAATGFQQWVFGIEEWLLGLL